MNSELGYYVQRTANTFLATHPLAANRARYLANDARHLHDMATQHRVNMARTRILLRSRFRGPLI
jgi:hypothetical protein